MQNFNMSGYFKRIKYDGSADVTLDTLYKLHTAHTFNIPFENLDVALHRSIALDIDALYDKLVAHRRGGYCFEMNGLFSSVLRQLGFKVTDLLARTALGGGQYSAKLHEVLLVELYGECYLADVGYGNDGIAAPLPLITGTEHTQFNNTYRFALDERYGYILERKSGAEFIPMYAFTLEECIPDDYDVANHFTSTHPSSFFRAAKFCTMPTPDGRINLTDSRLKITVNGEITETAINSEQEFSELLKRHFGIDDLLLE